MSARVAVRQSAAQARTLPPLPPQAARPAEGEWAAPTPTWRDPLQGRATLACSVRTGQQDKHLYPKDNIYPRNEFGLLLNNVFLIDNNGTDCGRDKEEEIYITSASVIELDCKKCADNDSYDSGIYNASTNTGNNTDLPQNLCYNILPHMKDQLSNCQSSVSIRLFPTFLWKFLISCRH